MSWTRRLAPCSVLCNEYPLSSPPPPCVRDWPSARWVSGPRLGGSTATPLMSLGGLPCHTLGHQTLLSLRGVTSESPSDVHVPACDVMDTRCRASCRVLESRQSEVVPALGSAIS